MTGAISDQWSSHRWSFDAIGTGWEIDTAEPIEPALRAAVSERIARFDAVWSRFRPDSLVARIAAAPDGGRFTFPAEARPLFALYDRLYAATDGAVDPLVGRDLELLGYDANYTLTPADPAARARHHDSRPRWPDLRRIPAAAEDEAEVGAEVGTGDGGVTLCTSAPAVVDVGAAGKGLLVDLVAELLHQAGVPAVVDASGDLAVDAAHEVAVGLQHPLQPRQVLGAVGLRGRALCASATTRRAWGNGLHHVLDARTGAPTHGVIATWAIADRAATADGLATALFFADPYRLDEQFDFDWVRLLDDGRCHTSAGFAGELFT